MIMAQVLGEGFLRLFVAPGNHTGFRLFSLDVLKLFTHAIGHASWPHLLGNFTFILLIGPILEERYGSGLLVLMMLVTAFSTGVLNVLFFPTGLLGASGIVFMFILLTSFTNVRRGEIPITFILVVLLFVGQEVYRAIAEQNNVSEFAHIIGGFFGALFGFFLGSKKETGKSVEDSISQV
ncbi:MAG: rhomboid family intramembrane serine protease [Spirochaetales bacterium]|nr:rhomboid family intramembrane serine protease [Spirochaetales bacterium]